MPFLVALQRGPPGSGGREPAISFHMSITYKDEMEEEIAQLADKNVDRLQDTLTNHYGVPDMRKLQW